MLINPNCNQPGVYETSKKIHNIIIFGKLFYFSACWKNSSRKFLWPTPARPVKKTFISEMGWVESCCQNKQFYHSKCSHQWKSYSCTLLAYFGNRNIFAIKKPSTLSFKIDSSNKHRDITRRVVRHYPLSF